MGLLRLLMQMTILLMGTLGAKIALAYDPYTDFNPPECDEMCRLYWHYDVHDPHFNERKNSSSKMRHAARMFALQTIINLFSNNKNPNDPQLDRVLKYDDIEKKSNWSMGLRASASKIRFKVEYKF